MSTASPSAPASNWRRHLQSKGSFAVSVATELWVGGSLVLASLLFGAVVAHRSGPTSLDRKIMSLVSQVHGVSWTPLAHLSSPAALVPAVVLCAAWALRQGLRNAAVCGLAPVVGVLVAQGLKHMVGRLDAGVSSYPSGSVAAVAAVAAVAVVAVARPWKPVAAVVGGALAIVMSLTVVALRWHFPTDALGGGALAFGLTMLIDAATLTAWPVRVDGSTSAEERRAVRERPSSTSRSRDRSFTGLAGWLIGRSDDGDDPGQLRAYTEVRRPHR